MSISGDEMLNYKISAISNFILLLTTWSRLISTGKFGSFAHRMTYDWNTALVEVLSEIWTIGRG